MTIYTLSVTLITDLFYLILIQTISNKAKKQQLLLPVYAQGMKRLL